MDVTTIITIVFSSSIATFGLGWFKDIYFDNRGKKDKRLQIQEDVYCQLMEDINFIYIGSGIEQKEVLRKKNRFIENYRILFLHAPDPVILGINELLEAMIITEIKDNEEMKERKKKIADSMLILRKQFVSRTKLEAKDFQHIK